MTERRMSGKQQKQLQELVEACGLDLVLIGLAGICAAKTGYRHYGGYTRAADAWLNAMTKLDVLAETPEIKAVS